MKYQIDIIVPLEQFESRKHKENTSGKIQQALNHKNICQFRVGSFNVKAKLKLIEFNTVDNKPFKFQSIDDDFEFWVNPNLEDPNFGIFFEGIFKT